MDKVGPILAGVSLLLLGFGIIIHPTFYDRLLEFQFNFTGYNIPLGIFMIIVGVLLLWTTLRREKKSKN
jgi:hypothetical protein